MGRRKTKIPKKLQEALDAQQKQVDIIKTIPLETKFGKALRDIIVLYDALGIDLETTKDQFECYTSDLFKSVKEMDYD